MNATFIIFAVAAVMLVVLVFVAVLASRYVKAGPNLVLIISGRKVQLPDGRFVGFRIVKGGGTFVFPVIERIDVLSLEVVTIEMPGLKAQTADGRAVEADCVAQVKIQSDDSSIVAAAEHFLSKSPTEIKGIVWPILERHLRSVLETASIEAASRNLNAFAARVQSSASEDLDRMGLGMISFTIRNARAA